MTRLIFTPSKWARQVKYQHPHDLAEKPVLPLSLLSSYYKLPGVEDCSWDKGRPGKRYQIGEEVANYFSLLFSWRFSVLLGTEYLRRTECWGRISEWCKQPSLLDSLPRSQWSMPAYNSSFLEWAWQTCSRPPWSTVSLLTISFYSGQHPVNSIPSQSLPSLPSFPEFPPSLRNLIYDLGFWCWLCFHRRFHYWRSFPPPNM